MKVSELIAKLQELPQDEQVVVETDAGGEVELYPITGVKATTCPTLRSQNESKPDPSFTVITSVDPKRFDSMTEEEKRVAFEVYMDAPLNEEE